MRAVHWLALFAVCVGPVNGNIGALTAAGALVIAAARSMRTPGASRPDTAIREAKTLHDAPQKLRSLGTRLIPVWLRLKHSGVSIELDALDMEHEGWVSDQQFSGKQGTCEYRVVVTSTASTSSGAIDNGRGLVTRILGRRCSSTVVQRLELRLVGYGEGPVTRGAVQALTHDLERLGYGNACHRQNRFSPNARFPVVVDMVHRYLPCLFCLMSTVAVVYARARRFLAQCTEAIFE